MYFRDISQTTGQHCTNFCLKNINTFSRHKCMVYKQPPQLETLLRLITQLFNTFFFHQQLDTKNNNTRKDLQGNFLRRLSSPSLISMVITIAEG